MIKLPEGHPDRMDITIDGKKLYLDHLAHQLEKAWEERNFSMDNRKHYEDLLDRYNTRNMNLK